MEYMDGKAERLGPEKWDAGMPIGCRATPQGVGIGTKIVLATTYLMLVANYVSVILTII